MKDYNYVATFPSKSNPDKKYTVKMDEDGNLTCDCPVWIYNHNGDRTCCHTVMAQKNGGIKTGKLITIQSNNYYGHTEPLICHNYPDNCDDCGNRFKCFTEENPIFAQEEIAAMKRGKVKIKAYLHSDKESMGDLGEELGLVGEALNKFCYALYEVTLELEVDLATGEYAILSTVEN